ncbi:N-acetyltransferase [Actinomycetes bacterium]|nr:N-acetyltransferase [Actinomycetes bacterium]
MTLVDKGHPGARAVTVWTLQQLDRAAVVPGRVPATVVEWQPVRAHKAELSAELYERVGRAWGWVDRACWTNAEWAVWANPDTHHLFVGRVGGEICGYVELDQQGTDVEVAFFGLLAEFMGQGIGGWLLGEGLREAWLLPGVERVWVHTCELDAPTALANYQARGLVICDTAIEWRLATVQ